MCLSIGFCRIGNLLQKARGDEHQRNNYLEKKDKNSTFSGTIWFENCCEGEDTSSYFSMLGTKKERTRPFSPFELLNTILQILIPSQTKE